MRILIINILSYFVFGLTAQVYAEDTESLTKVLEATFKWATSNVSRNALSNGTWNADKTIYVIATRNESTNFIYAFVKEEAGDFTSIKIWEFESSDIHGKLGRPYDYYDRFEIIPRLWAETDAYRLGVSIITRAWKDGQRYTTESKSVRIKMDGSLDWSQF